MKNLAILGLFIIFNATMGFCFSEEDISNIELAKYDDTYKNETISQRLNRLENDYFGMTQSGGIEDRILQLNKISNNLKQSAILNTHNYYKKRNNGIKNFWNNITSTFDDGYITGFTPPMYNTEYLSGYPQYENTSGIINFAPFENRHHPFYNKHHNDFIKNHHKRTQNHHFNHQQKHRLNNHYNPNKRITRTRYSIPPNITTQSSVHIIRD